jgi:hypothetical protein
MRWLTNRVRLPFGDAEKEAGPIVVEREVVNAA